MNLHSISRRFALGAALGLSAVLGLSGTVLADTETGQHGHYSFRDSDSANPPVACVYNGSNPYHLVSIVVKAPQLWWPDTNSSINNQHGKVGWRAIVRVSLPGAYGPFNKVKQSDIQTATAHEDNPAYDLNDKASLSKVTFSFNAANYSSHPNAHIAVRIKAYWYNTNGSVMGTVTHDVFNYEWRGAGSDYSTTACPIRVTIV